MKLLITTPYLRVIGGTEIETLTTAQALAELGKFEEIQIFSPYKFDLGELGGLAESSKISFISYPNFFKNNYVQKVSHFILSRISPGAKNIEDLFWYSKRVNRYDFIYMLTSTTDNYYLPILKKIEPESCLTKFTLIYNDRLPPWKKVFFQKVKQNIVASSKQKQSFKEKFDLSNVVVQDILIANEENLLKCNSNRQYTFGILCRFSREKQVEDSILLIKTLKEQGAEVNLIIQGEGDEEYQKEIQEMIFRHKLQESITLIRKGISPLKTHLFYEKISFFLITSKFETGPMTGLEAMAAGVPVLSYDVGAMKERMGDMNFMVVDGLKELAGLAEKFINLGNYDYTKLSTTLRNRYISHCSNAGKVEKLEQLIFNNG
jgi:glycosyltransferase involved in cell wall biosynthesis